MNFVFTVYSIYLIFTDSQYVFIAISIASFTHWRVKITANNTNWIDNESFYQFEVLF